ncbi:hypothetical protein C0J52_19933, partial [Blattella germanica]
QVSGFILWRHLKCVVYRNRPANFIQLENNLRQAINDIPIDNMCRRTMSNVFHHAQECLQQNGRHLTDIILRTMHVRHLE